VSEQCSARCGASLRARKAIGYEVKHWLIVTQTILSANSRTRTRCRQDCLHHENARFLDRFAFFLL